MTRGKEKGEAQALAAPPTDPLGNNADPPPTRDEIALGRLARPGLRAGGILQILPSATYTYLGPEKLYAPTPDGIKMPPARKPGGSPIGRLLEVEWLDDEARSVQFTEPSPLQVPAVDATTETLGRFGCRIIEPGHLIHITHASIVADFTYGENYVSDYVLRQNGGPGIEHHAFDHVDIPLDSPSGHLVLGRASRGGSRLEIAAFTVQKGSAVHIPPGVLHTNDYFRGRWRTVLSAHCEVLDAKLKDSRGYPMRFITQPGLPGPGAGGDTSSVN